MKLTWLLIALLLLGLVGRSFAEEQPPTEAELKEFMDVCGELTPSEAPEDECNDGVACAKCSCTGARPSRGFRDAEQLKASGMRDSNGKLNTGAYCISIWSWLAPMIFLAVVLTITLVYSIYRSKKWNETRRQSELNAQVAK